ncbi:MAG: 2-phosphosulfolactate phosphatase [Bacillota bacterium]
MFIENLERGLIYIHKLYVYPMWQNFHEDEVVNSAAVVIDVFRASNTIISALGNGAKEIIPVAEINLAQDLKEKHPEYLLGGERNSLKIEGFDLGNSPLEYTQIKVNNKTVILATSNGSKALKKVDKADIVLIASFANIKAIVKKLKELEKDIHIVCAGTLGTPSLEDTLAAGKIVDELMNITDFNLNDYAYLTLGSYHNYKFSIYNTLLKSRNGLRLQELGKMADIRHCSQVDTTELIPIYIENKITL